MISIFIINGRVIEQNTQRGISGLQVQVWDKDLLVDDLVGSTVTDTYGGFHLEFDESYFQELFLDRIPDIFIKIFKNRELIHSTEGSLTWQLEPGENSITVEVKGDEGYDQETLFDLLITRPTDVFSEPDGEIITQLKPGEYVTAIALDGKGYNVRLANESIGWVKFSDLDDLQRRLDFFTGAAKVEPILSSEVVSTIRSHFQQGEGMPHLERIIGQVTLLNGLLDQAQGVLRYNLEAMARFDTMLALLIDHAAPPPRPQNFTLAVLRNEAFRAGLDIPRFSPNRNLPCLVNLDAVGLLGSAILRSARHGGPDRLDDDLWAGLWVMGNLLDGVNHLGTLYTSIKQGNVSFAQILEQNMAELPENTVGDPFPSNIQPTSSHIETPAVGWEPSSGRIPGTAFAPAFDCQIEQWERTVRALRCCGQTYRIDRVTTNGCYGDEVTIEGEGFGDSRLWGFPPRAEPDDPHPLPGPFESVVLFPSRVGALVSHGDGFRPNPTDMVEGREYVSWTDTEIVVRLPRGAISGPVEIRIICDETLRSRRTVGREVTDFDRCGLETKLPEHDPRDLDTHATLQESQLVSLSVMADGMRTRADDTGRLEVLAEGCTPVSIEVEATDVQEVTIVNSRGEIIDFPAGAPGLTRYIRADVNVSSALNETYTVTLSGSCAGTSSAIVVINRYLVIRPSVPRYTYDAAIDSEIPLMVRLSCTPDELGVPAVRVRLNLTEFHPAVRLVEPEVTIRGSSQEITTTITVGPTACGMFQLDAQTIGDAPFHRLGASEFVVLGQPIVCAFAGTAVVRIRKADGSLPDWPLRPIYTRVVTASLRFGADRSSATVLTFAVAPISTPLGDVNLIQTGGGMGTYQCGGMSSGSLSIPFSIAIDAPFPIPDTNVTGINLTTESVMSPGGVLTNAGARINFITGGITIVGAGVGMGGIGNGLHIDINLAGTLSPAPPLCCAGS